jgi:hypothetical protein
MVGHRKSSRAAMAATTVLQVFTTVGRFDTGD